MMLFTILVIMVVAITVGGAFALVANGLALLALFIELIICIGLIVLIAKHFYKKWKSKK